MDLQVIDINAPVFHVGKLNGQLAKCTWKRMGMYEGNTLSVSLCPEEWKSKAQINGDLYSIAKNQGSSVFADMSSLSTSTIRVIIKWAIQNGFISFDKKGDIDAETKLLDNMLLSSCYNGCSIDYAIMHWMEEKIDALDGIWYTEKCSAGIQYMSRGGIFQSKLSHFSLARQNNFPLISSAPKPVWETFKIKE